MSALRSLKTAVAFIISLLIIMKHSRQQRIAPYYDDKSCH